VEVEEVRLDNCVTEPAYDYTLFYGKDNTNHHL